MPAAQMTVIIIIIIVHIVWMHTDICIHRILTCLTRDEVCGHSQHAKPPAKMVSLGIGHAAQARPVLIAIGRPETC